MQRQALLCCAQIELIVGHLRLHTSSIKEGKSAEVSDGGGTEMEVAAAHFC